MGLRLTFIIYSLSCGGAERVMSRMANHFAGLGHEVTILTFENGDAAPFYEISDRVTIRPLGLGRASRGAWQKVRNLAWRLGRLRRAVVETRPDAVLSFMAATNMLAILSLIGTGIPVVAGERSDPRFEPAGRLPRAIRPLIYRLAEAIVCQTDEARGLFPAFLHKRISVTPNPVPHPLPPVASGADTRIVAGLGRLRPEKGFDHLIRAFARAAEQAPGWTLVIWGEGPQRPMLEGLVEELGLAGRARLPGETGDPQAALAGAEIFALSSKYEGFPNALVEAMAAGLPAVCFDSAGTRAVIENGINGILTPNQDTKALAQALAGLMADAGRRRALGRAALGIRDRLSETAVFARWEKLLVRAAWEKRS